MSHYFLEPEQPGREYQVHATIWGREHTFTTADGVFSHGRLDPGTAVLFRATLPPQGPVRLLDLGCGFGPIAVALACQSPEAVVDAVDTNSRALDLTRRNAEAAGVGARVRALPPDQLPAGTRYDEIWSNPPIRIGKAALHDLLLGWLPRLGPEGIAWLVVQQHLGADSLQSWLTAQNWPTERVASAKGYRVLRTVRGQRSEQSSNPS